MPALITLQQIKDARPCQEGWDRILSARGGKSADMQEKFPLVSALDSNPVAHVVWALRCVANGKELATRYALGCAEMVRHLMKDRRSLAALDGVAAHLRGEPVDLLATRRDAADAAADAAAYAAAAAAAAAYAAAADAAAAYAATADAAAAAAYAATADAARQEITAQQKQLLISLLS